MTEAPSIETLRRAVRRLHLVVGLLGVVVVALAVRALRPTTPDVIRTRGLVVEDASGRARILIGAPIPVVAERVRTDTAKARAAWGEQMGGDRYMGYYASYRHSTHGMLVLDERGFDRLAIGDSTPDPNIGNRLGPATGIQINDAMGFERSGYGLLRVDGLYRVVLGLDGSDGREGVALSLFDQGPAGLWAYGPGGESYFAGRDGSTSSRDGALLGWSLRRGDSVVMSQTMPVRR